MKKQNKLLIAVLLILSLIFGIGGVAAKYVTGIERIGVAKALEFYLSSDMLPGDHTFPAGTKSVSFTVGNYADDLRFAEMPIQCVVKVFIGGTEVTDNLDIHNKTFELKENQKSEVVITIGNSGTTQEAIARQLQAGKTYSIEVTGNGGYTQTLKGTFTVLSPETGPFYFVEDKDGYTELTIWCRGIAEEGALVTIKYEVTAIPDNTNPHMEGWLSDTNGAGKTITLKPYESYRYQFFNTSAERIQVTGASPKQPE